MAFQRLLSNPRVLLGTTAILFLASLGMRPLWGQEGRWAVICREMIASGDYFHPHLMGFAYDDKPLLSYWLMIGCARVLGGLSEWALRLPSAVAAWLSVWCVLRIGRVLFGQETGILAGWILGTMALVNFWARVSSADMLNVAAIMAALAWYFERRDRPGFAAYTVFMVLLAVGGLLKGLVAPAVVGIALLPELATGDRWRRSFKWSLFPALGIGVAVYLTPFLLARWTGSSTGLIRVYWENLVRYVSPFDHRESWTHYLYQLPLYLLPWTIFLPALFCRAVRCWKTMSPAARWPLLSSGLVFLFFEGSGSRRDYYLLPLLPLVSLAIADWLSTREEGSFARRGAQGLVVGTAGLLLAWFGILQPYFATLGGSWVFQREVKEAAERVAPYPSWRLVSWGAPPDADYYLSPSGRTEASFGMEEVPKASEFLAAHPRSILVTYGKNRSALEPRVKRPIVVEQRPMAPSWLRRFLPETPSVVAFIQTGETGQAR